MKQKYKVNDTFVHLETERMYICCEAIKYKDKNDVLYTFKEVTPSNDAQHKRCYQSKVTEKYMKVKNSKAVKILYGKK